MNLNIREFGPGKCRGLWLHGWLGSGREGGLNQKALGQGYTLCCPDLPGHGETAIADGTLDGTLEAIARLARNCDWAGGYSMGGRLLMMAAAKYPDAFKTLVIESASLGLVDTATRDERKRVDHQRAEQLKAQGLDAFCEEWYQMDIWGGFTDFPSREGKTSELASALELFSVGNQPELRPWIKNTPCRILWLAGKKDPVYANQALWVKGNTPHQVALFDAGHNVHLQARDAWGKVLCEFLCFE